MPPNEPPSVHNILVVDDHPVVRRGIINLLSEQSDLHVVGEASSEAEALEVFHSTSPDLVVVDWSLRQNDSRGVITELLRNKPDLAVLVVSIHDETTHAEQAARVGARGYLMKQEAAHKIVEGSRTVLSGTPYFSPRALEYLSEGSRRQISEQAPGSKSPNAGGARQVEQAWKHSVSVIIPVYNSESTVARLCSELIDSLRFVRDLQILLVDDGSSDDSASLCTEMHFRYPHAVEFVELARNFGEHSALLAGLQHARGDFCVLMDDDLQNPPSEVPRLLRQAALGFDAVYAAYRKRRHPWYRRAASALHNAMATAILDKPRNLYFSSFKVLSRDVVRQIRKYRGPKPYLDALILRATANISTVESEHRTRAGGSSGYTLSKLIELWTRMLFGFSTFPVRFCFLLSLGTLAMWVGLVALPTESSSGIQIDRYARMLPWATALLWAGVFGEYIARLYQLLHRTPPYVIRRMLRKNLASATGARPAAHRSSAA